MDVADLPQRIVNLCRSFLSFEERAEFLQRFGRLECEYELQAKFQCLLKEVCQPNATKIDSDRQDATARDCSRNEDGPQNDSQCIDGNKSLRLSDDTVGHNENEAPNESALWQDAVSHESCGAEDEAENDPQPPSVNKSPHLLDDTVEHNDSVAANETALYDPPTSPFNDNDDDDRAIRADAAIIREREHATEFALQPSDLYELGDSEEEVESSSQVEHPSPPSSLLTTGSVEKLLSLKLDSLQLQLNSEDGCQDGRKCCLTEGDAVKARYRGSKEFYPAKVTFCHTNDLFDIEYDDGDQDTLVPRDAIRLLISKKPATDNSEQAVEAQEELAHEIVAGAGVADKQIDSIVISQEQPEEMDTPMALESLSHSSDEPLYALGDAVEANFLGMGKFHRGRVVQFHEDNRMFDIQYTDFEEIETRVPGARIRVPITGKSSSRDLLDQADCSNSATPRLAQTRKSTSTALRSSLRSSILSPRDTPEGRGATTPSATNSKGLVVSNIPEAQNAKRTHLKSARPLTTSSSSRSRSSQEKQQIVTARKGASKSSKHNASEISWRELEEWKNVDLILNRKRRFLNSLSGGIESAKVPWGEEFAAIQSLKRFTMQHPDVLRAHIASQLEEVGAASRSSGSQSARIPSLSSAAAGQTREALLLIKDLSFLLKQRLTPFLDVILPAVLPAVFNAEKRFLCDSAYEVLEALVLHCSGRRLVLLLLEHGEECAKCDDVRLLNLTSVYVEKCFSNLNTAEIDALMARSSVCVSILTSLANLLLCKAAPSKIAAQKSLTLIRAALHDIAFERMVRAVLSEEMATVILRHTLFSNTTMGIDGNGGGSRSPTARSPSKLATQSLSPVVVHQGMSILQRMVVQRQNRVLPAPE